MMKALAAAALLLAAPAAARPAPAASTGTLVLCDDEAEPRDLDPHRVFENKSDDILFQVYEGLYRLGESGALEPALAEDCRWPDARTLRCVLRRGVFFHNGDPLDAEAVRWSIARAMDPALRFPAAAEFASIESVSALDDHTVEIRTGRPDALLLRRLAIFLKIASPRYFREAGPERFAAAPVGTGPFRFERWEPGRELVLAANADYWDRGRPRLSRVVFKFVPARAQAAQLLAGKLDAITEVPPASALEIAADARDKIVKRSVLATPAFWFSSFNGPLKDRRVRRALNMAVDKGVLIRYASRGNGRPIASFSMPGETGHDARLAPYAFSRAAARELLAQAGYPRGFDLAMLVSEQAAREAGIIAAQWKAIGVRATVTTVSLSELAARVGAPKDERPGFEVAANLAPDPAAHVYFLAGLCFYSKSPFSRLDDPTFDRLYEAISSAGEPAGQLAAAERLDDYIHDEALGVFTYQKIRTFAMNRALDLPIPQTGVLDLRDAAWRR